MGAGTSRGHHLIPLHLIHCLQMRPQTVWLAAMLHITLIATAQNPSLVSLDTLTVSALRTDMPARETGRHITVLEGKDIQQLPVSTLDELLRYVPGVEAQSRGAFGVQSDFSMRGATFSQVLVLIDGMRVNDPLTAHFNSNLPVNPREIARIEILKGPAAAMYGADAMGGVIHIITKLYASRVPKGVDYDVQGAVGQYGLLSTTGFVSVKKGKSAGTAGFMRHQADGHPLPTGDSARFNVNTLSLAYRYSINEQTRLIARTGFDYRDFNARYFYTRSPFDESVETTQAWWNHLHLQHHARRSSWTADLGYRWNSDYFLFNAAFPPANEHITALINGQLHHQYRKSDRLRTAAGMQATRRSIVSNDRGNHTEWQTALYGAAYWQPVATLSVNAGLRGDLDENYGFEMSPQLSMAWQANRHTLRLAAGRSIRAADFTERFISTNLAGPLSSGRNLGNPDLSAEQAWSAEVGVDIRPASWWEINATTYARKSTNLIDYVITGYDAIPRQENLTPGASYLFATNIAQVNTLGAEISLWAQQQWRTITLSGRAGYNINRITPNEPVNAKYITGQARHLVNGSLEIRHQLGTLSFTGLYKVRDEEEVPAINAFITADYMVWHMRAEMNLWQQRLFYSLQIHNLFNENYADILGAQMPGRWWNTGLRWRTAAR